MSKPPTPDPDPQVSTVYDNTTAITDNYEAIAYDARPNPVSHPDHVAAVATMFGFTAPEVTHARVLELGCSDGANLLPVAATLPDSHCVGCDIAPTAIRRAREATTALGLRNVEWFACDLRELPAVHREPFDYIIAHGMYSWVPLPVRDALLGLAARMLAPRGLLFISYNALPGGHTRRAVSEMLRHHTANVSALRDKLVAARELAALLADAGATQDAADASVQAELRRIAEMTDSQLAHDAIAEPNEFVYFHDFVAHAARFGLAYLAEAAPVMMGGAGLSANMRGYLARLERIAREQYIDFARLRRFRQSLLVRVDAPCNFDLQQSRMQSLFAMASMPLLQAAREGRLPGGAGESSLSIRRRMLDRMVAMAPASVPVSDLLLNVGETDGAASAKTAEATLFDAWISGFVQFRTKRLHLARTASDRIEAFALARWQATTGTAITNLRHETIRLTDPFARELLTLLDGSRDREELSRALASRGSFGDASAVAKRVQGGIDLLAEFGLLIR